MTRIRQRQKLTEKRGIRREQLLENATISTRKYGIAEKASISNEDAGLDDSDIERIDDFHKNPPKGSLAEKASIVYRFNHNIPDDDDSSENS